MYTFAQRSAITEDTSAEPVTPDRAEPWQSNGSAILHLQRTIGNLGAQRWLHGGAEGPGAGSRPQAKLTVNAPGDVYEQEADAAADRVTRMSGDQSPAKPLSATLSPVVQTESEGGVDASPALSREISSSSGGGSRMDDNTEAFMQSRFGADFSPVRIHTDDDAGRMNRALGAQAFTVGRDIYFAPGKYSPGVDSGKHLLAHELTHTVQQGGRSGGHASAQLMIQKTDGDKAATAFGEFEAVKYHALKQVSDHKEIGVEMFMKFNPGAKVDAKQIGMTQAATGKVSGTSVSQAGTNYGRRSASTGPGTGYFIDRLTDHPSPMYASDTQPTAGADASKLTSYPVTPSTALTAAQITAGETATGVSGHTRSGGGAKFGFQFVEAGAKKGPQSAELSDAPQLGPDNDSEQIFESTALAIEGTQKDTYYGSVTWGWKRDGAGKFSTIPFKAVSQGTPSTNFLTAASIWNAATEDFNWGVNAASAAILDPADMSQTKATVSRGTALEWGGQQGTAGGVTYNVVRVKDGASKGTVGVIKSSDMSQMDVGRPTVDLPITVVYKSNSPAAPMVSDPAKASGTVILNLPKDTRVTMIPPPAGAKANPDWSFIKIVDGPDTEKTGWVKTSMLTKEALGTH